jgi:hypothetical protein
MICWPPKEIINGVKYYGCGMLTESDLDMIGQFEPLKWRNDMDTEIDKLMDH